MVKQVNDKIVREIDKLNENENLAAQGYVSQMLSKRLNTPDNLQKDDLILSLADAYENQRARQVIEWDRIRRQNLYRAV
jgi:hypothetical protein